MAANFADLLNDVDQQAPSFAVIAGTPALTAEMVARGDGPAREAGRQAALTQRLQL